MIFLTQLEDLFWASLYTEVLSLKGIFVTYFYYQIVILLTRAYCTLINIYHRIDSG